MIISSFSYSKKLIISIFADLNSISMGITFQHLVQNPIVPLTLFTLKILVPWLCLTCPWLEFLQRRMQEPRKFCLQARELSWDLLAAILSLISSLTYLFLHLYVCVCDPFQDEKPTWKAFYVDNHSLLNSMMQFSCWVMFPIMQNVYD